MRRFRPWLRVPFLVLLALAATAAWLPAEAQQPEAPAAAPPPCEGDETISFAPPNPAPGQPFVAAVTSRRQHIGVWLSGPVFPTQTREHLDDANQVWEYFFVIFQPGWHNFTFYVESVHACASASLLVGDEASASPPESLFPTNPFQPAPPGGESAAPPPEEATPTPSRAVRVVRRVFEASGNENEESDGSDPSPTREPTATREPTPTRVPTPTRTATPRPERPEISGVNPDPVRCREGATISGRGFGSRRSDVDGKVEVDGAQADVGGWSSTEIRITVPASARAGPERSLVVETAGGRSSRTVRVTC